MKFDGLTGFALKKLKSPIIINYGSIQFSISKNGASIGEEIDNFPIGKVLFTETGSQLANLSNVEPISGFYEYLEAKFSSLGYSVSKSILIPSE